MKNYIELVFSDDKKSCRIKIGNTLSPELLFRDDVSNIIYSIRLLGFINNDQANILYKELSLSDLCLPYEEISPPLSYKKLITMFIKAPESLEEYIPKTPEIIVWEKEEYGFIGMIFLPNGKRSRIVVSKIDAQEEVERLHFESGGLTEGHQTLLFDQIEKSTLSEVGTVDEYIDITTAPPDDIFDDEDDYNDNKEDT